MLDDVLDVSGPVERTGKSRGTDLLDGTVTLPLILAREREPELAAFDLASLEGPAQAEALCERIAATGALDEARERALAVVAEAKAALPAILPRRPLGAARPGRRRGRRALPLSDSEVAGDDQVGVERADEELDFVGHVRVRHASEVAQQRARAAVELVVEPLDGRLLEDALAPRLALGAAQHDPPVPGALLAPVERIDELAGAVKADVQLIRRSRRRRRLPSRWTMSMFFAGGRLCAVIDAGVLAVWISVWVHGFPHVIDPRAGRL